MMPTILKRSSLSGNVTQRSPIICPYDTDLTIVIIKNSRHLHVASVGNRRAYQNAYHHTKYRTDEAYNERHMARAKAMNARAQQDADAIIATFRENGNALCSEKSACCLVAHHPDPAQKNFHAAQAKSKHFGRARISV